MLSARFVQSTRIQKSVPKQLKDLQAAGGPMWCSDVPCFAEIISGALEATGSAKGALGPTQAARPGHQFSLSPQTVLGALWVSVLRGKFMWRSGTWDLADDCPCSEGDVWSMNLVCLAPLITEEAGQCVSVNSALREKLSSIDCRDSPGFHWATLYIIFPEFCPWELVLLKCPFSANSKLFSS